MAGLYSKLGRVSAVCASLSGLSLIGAYCVCLPIWMRLIAGILGGILLVLSLVYGWILIQRPYPNQSLLEVSILLFIYVFMGLKGKSEHAEIMKTCKNPMRHQRNLWQEILNLNKRTAYADDHGLRGMQTLGDLRKRHPLTSYERYRPYVDRMTEGEENILVDGLPDSYIRTTGTTGKPKYIPQKQKSKMLMRMGAMMAYISDHHYSVNPLAKSLYLYVAPKVLKTKCGTVVETAATMSEDQDWVFAMYPSPASAYKLGTMHEAFYLQLLFALKDRNLGRVIVGFIHFLESAMKLLEKEWENLTRDIEQGALNDDLNIPQAIREGAVKELKTYGPDPDRAAELRAEFQKGFVGIIRRIWPNVQCVMGIDSNGSWPRLSKTYSKGLTLLTPFYGCSESCLAINPGPDFIKTKGYIPLVKWAVMEFIKEQEMSSSNPQTFFLHELELGEKYEIVITQPFGLYRYRMGDVIEVIDFHQDMPIINFLYRTGQMLNVRYEKLDQRIVSDSVLAATAKWADRTLVEFSVAESTMIDENCSIYEPKEMMPYYIFFLEMKDSSSEPLSEEQKSMIDKELQDRNSDVKRLRGEGAISHPRVHLVRPGAFAELQHYIITNTGATANQYKPPRKLRTPAILEVMVKNIVQ
ncbi:jasmonoyl--L-amino acid synthetase JAR4-like [Lytechinus variegatus]|uniref:jasmonoyl--L-amino acid synthetase JAR4-like n=1 Tax=Lytechinus variegatus TaxID=7654 RepID=UPI001BB0F267|nr:jasmonoyl--L-amino acid synthetase JAR4-like [Lytechinus variegatus]